MTATVPASGQRLRDALSGTYAIDRELGRGGMATVYLAQDERHDRLVALKVLHAEIAESLGAERFLREIRTAARLNHPHILPLFDSGAVDGFLYYVMPYVEGESLRQTLDRLGQIPVEDAIAYTQEMSAALDYAHRQGIVHRDIKPENVMVHEGIAMLMDFGIAKALGSDSSGTLTSVGMLVGTPAYMSPEQAFGESTIDGRSDQFSLACVLYEMITGKQPFSGATAHAIIAQRMSAATPDLDELSDRAGSDVESALRRAMSLDAANRFETTRDFGAALSQGRRSTPAALRMMSAPITSAAKSIAILPFENRSADPENDYLADGIAEEIINSLSKVRTLRVASRTTSFPMRSRRDDLQEVGRKLKVSTIMNGSVRRSANRIRVTAELVNVSDGSQLWAERYDREMEDVFEIQDDISESIVRALRVIMGDAERKALKAKTRDIRAYEYYLRGRQYVDLRRKSLEYAMDMFRRAVEIDPEFASAHAGIADGLSLMFLLFDTNKKFIDEAEAASARALELEPDLAEAHLARGMEYSCLRDYEISNREFETAMRLDPKLFEAPYFHGRNLIWQGRSEDAVRVLRHAQTLRPESYDVPAMLALAYTTLGRTAEAKGARLLGTKLMKERLELNPDDVRAWMLLAVQYAETHDRARAEDAIQRALSIEDDAMTYYNASCAHALLGDEEKSLDYLEGAISRGWHHKEWLDHDTDFAFMRENPRFKKISARLGG
jgi:serine/threonine protein kinase/Flp pilus assembly protein TadD